jgi:hypothetical protein
MNLEKNNTYICVYVCNSPPHVLTRYVSNKIMARKVAYQTMEFDVEVSFQTLKKRIFPSFPFKLGKFILTNIPHMRKEVISLKELILCIVIVKKHGPRNVLYNYYKSLNMVPPSSMK